MQNLTVSVITFAVVLILSTGINNGSEVTKFDYVVVGAGPAGLQMGYFLETAGRNYIVMERSNNSGKTLY